MKWIYCVLTDENVTEFDAAAIVLQLLQAKTSHHKPDQKCVCDAHNVVDRKQKTQLWPALEIRQQIR